MPPTYAVHDEPIAAPELKDIDDGHNQVSYTDTRNATTATKVDNSLPRVLIVLVVQVLLPVLLVL